MPPDVLNNLHERTQRSCRNKKQVWDSKKDKPNKYRKFNNTNTKSWNLILGNSICD